MFSASKSKNVSTLHLDVEISITDKKRLYEIAYKAGTTPTELIAGFIGDLTAGADTGGSDERELATRYLERRYCAELLPKDFLQWALYDYQLDDVADALAAKKEAENDLEYYADHPEEPDPGELEEIKDTIADADRELSNIYNAYMVFKEKRGESPQPYDDGIATIRKYMQELTG